MTRISSFFILFALSSVLFSGKLIAQHEPAPLKYPLLQERGVLRDPSPGTRIKFNENRKDGLKSVDVKRVKVSVYKTDPQLQLSNDSDLYDVVQQYEFYNPNTKRLEWIDATAVSIIKESAEERSARLAREREKAQQERRRRLVERRLKNQEIINGVEAPRVESLPVEERYYEEIPKRSYKPKH